MKLLITIFNIFVLFCVLLLTMSYINHRRMLSKETNLLRPLGQLVEVEGHKMSVYTAGKGDKTLVFLSGGGTTSPILDFKALTSQLTDDYRIVVIEKFGYGFSDDVKEERPISRILANSRAALKKAGVTGPYILVPHSISGLEALYWAQQYPDEVSAIVGLDMAVPAVYEDYPLNLSLIHIAHLLTPFGLTRWFPNIVDKELLGHEKLTEREKDIYRALFHRRPLSSNVVQEVKSVKENAKRVATGGIPQIPMLFFMSNGEGVGMDKDRWKHLHQDYAQEVENSQLIYLDASHYVHDYAYRQIAKKMNQFLQALNPK